MLMAGRDVLCTCIAAAHLNNALYDMLWQPRSGRQLSSTVVRFGLIATLLFARV